jgi:hypothetical protein
MRLFHDRPRDDAQPPPSADRLGGVRPVFHDEDERPSREDRDYGQTIFTRGTVPLPRVLRGGKRKRS